MEKNKSQIVTPYNELIRSYKKVLAFIDSFGGKLDGVGPVDNRPSTD